MQTPTLFNLADSPIRQDFRASTKEEVRQRSVVSMFSGCGGMDLGFTGGFEVFGRKYERLPFHIVWANEINEAACRTYRRNLGNHIICGDVWNAIPLLPTNADVIIGGFPCQDVSINGKRLGLKGKRSSLYLAMIEAIRRVSPKVFVVENVKGLLTLDRGRAIQRVLDDFGSLGYNLNWRLYRAADYGVPQNRERVLIIGTSADVRPYVAPKPERHKNHWMTASEAISDLEEVLENRSINHVWSRANRSPEQGNRKLLGHRPSHTIRAECHGNIQYHYKLRRRISMREAARFQSFPDKFIFEAKLRETERQVGNAVPPILAWHIARSVAKCFEDTSD